MSGTERRRGPSTSAISFGGVIAIASLLASGVATYNSVKNEIDSLKRADAYHERANVRQDEDIRLVRVESRETMKEFNEKLDVVIETEAAKTNTRVSECSSPLKK